MKVRDYKDLNVWQKGIEIVDKIYELTDSFPKSELYGLAGQMRRAAVSIASNIAEGFARKSNKEYKQFLYISLGSCAELDTQLVIAGRRNYIADKDARELAEEINHESRMLSSLINKLKLNSESSNEQRATSDGKRATKCV
ncbi:MAG: four helix bundle protein [Phycisphaerae bacterium]|jgi:four helix bundle protein